MIKSLGPGLYGRVEFGFAFTADGEMSIFFKDCVGARNYIKFGFQLTFGVWTDLANMRSCVVVALQVIQYTSTLIDIITASLLVIQEKQSALLDC